MSISDIAGSYFSQADTEEPQDMPTGIDFMTEDDKEEYIERNATFNDTETGYICPTCKLVYLSLWDALFCCQQDCYESMNRKEPIR